jgi:hypothetical protein
MSDRPQTVGPERDVAVGYRPVSGLAIAAVLLAGATTVAVVAIAVLAKVGGQPVLTPTVLVLAAISLGVAFAARWHVRRSEGARGGMGLARTAIWLSVLCFGGYGAYFAATDLVVRQQAQAEAERFFLLLAENKPELAFRLTRDPGQRRGIPDDPKDPKTAEAIRARFGPTDLHHFLESDLTRLYRTWADKDKLRLRFTGPGQRQELPNGFIVVLIYTIHTPEGEFDVDVWVRGVEDKITGGRDWQIMFPQTAVRDQRRYTHLGRIVTELQHVVQRQFVPHWQQELPQQKPVEVAKIVRVEGAPPPEEQRAKLVEELRQPGAINPAPGTGMLRRPGLPSIYFDPNAIRLVQTIQVKAPAVSPPGTPQCPAALAIGVDNAALVSEMLKLAGPDWEREPLLPWEEYPSQLVPYKFALTDLKVTEMNLRPSQPPIATPQGP